MEYDLITLDKEIDDSTCSNKLVEEKVLCLVFFLVINHMAHHVNIWDTIMNINYIYIHSTFIYKII